MAGACDSQEGEKKCMQSFGKNTWRRERPLGRTKHEWQDSIKLHVQKMGLIGLGQGSLQALA